MRNRWGVDVKRGQWAWAHHPRGGVIEGRVIKIENEPGRGRVVTLDSGYSVALDDVSKVLGPMTVGRDGTVKQNPDKDFRSVELMDTGGLEYGADVVTPQRFEFTTVARRRKRRDVYASYALPADVIASRDFQQWARNNHGAVFMSYNELKSKLKSFAGPRSNPRSRVEISSPSQREHINPRTGKPTKRPTKRLTARRMKTAATKVRGVYANPVDLGPVKAKPVHGESGFIYYVQVWHAGAGEWSVHAAFRVYEDAAKFAKSLHRDFPSKTIRVIDQYA